MKERHEEEIERKDEFEEIDLLQLARNVWDEKKFLLKWAVVGAIVGLVIALSIPNEYTTTIRLVSETSGGSNSSSSINAIARMAGMSSGQGSQEAVNPQLYPDIVKSAPFALELFDVNVTDKKGHEHWTVKEYLQTQISRPWWSTVVALPGKAVDGITNLFKSEEKAGKPVMTTDTTIAGVGSEPRRLTPGEVGVAGALASRISAAYNQKNAIISITVTMQDPMVSAILADTVTEKLKEYVIRYRTDKARADLEFAQKLNDEAREEYYKAQQKYAAYTDRNQGIVSRSGRTEEERLQNEMQLAYGLFNSTSQQLQVAKAKVQDITPVFSVLDPSTVPTRPSSPAMFFIVGACLALGLFGAIAWVLFGRALVAQFKAKGKKDEDEAGDERSETE